MRCPSGGTWPPERSSRGNLLRNHRGRRDGGDSSVFLSTNAPAPRNIAASFFRQPQRLRHAPYHHTSCLEALEARVARRKARFWLFAPFGDLPTTGLGRSVGNGGIAAARFVLTGQPKDTMRSAPTSTANVAHTALMQDLETKGALDGWDRPGALLPIRPCPAGGTRATLMVLTGTLAGQLVMVDGAAVVIGRAADAGLIVDEDGVSSHHARVGSTAEGGFYVQDLESENGTFVGSRRIDVAPLSEGDRIQLGPQFRMRFAMLDATEESLYRRLYESSVRDPLTQVFNRRYLADRLVAEIAHARRTKGDVAILMADLDRLKEVNDRFGHLAGDRALCLVASRLLGVIRVEDVLARYGGDEFVILARETDRAEATLLAERIHRAIETLPMGAAGGEPVGMTMSVGVASLLEVEPTDEPALALLALADERMYRAKSWRENGQSFVRTS